MLVTEFGIVIEAKTLQSRNAESPMLVSPNAIVTLQKIEPHCFATVAAVSVLPEIEVNLLHLENAYDPMLVTLSGIVIEVKPLHPENASYSMLIS